MHIDDIMAVRFAMPAQYTRPAREDEISVLSRFCRHISACQYCDYRRFASNAFINDRSMCARGHDYARDVNKYVYCRRGQTYSTFETGKGHLPMRVEIPPQYTIVRRLLEAVEYGSCLQHGMPPPESQWRPVHRSYQPIQEQKQHRDPTAAFVVHSRDAVCIYFPRGGTIIL